MAAGSWGGSCMSLLRRRALIKSVGGDIPTDGLINYWPYNGNTNDEAGTKNLINVDAVLTTDRNAVADKAYQFNGSSAWMTNPTYPALPKFSVCFWYKADAFLNHQIFIGKTELTSFGKGWAVEYNVGKISFFINHWDSIGVGSNHVNIATTDTSGWHFVYASYDEALGSQNLKLSLDNGTPVTVDLSAAIVEGATFTIGRGFTTNFMEGKMDDFRIYDRILTPTGITALYNE